MSNQVQPRLQVIATASLLAQPVLQLSPPVLITQVDSASVKSLATILSTQFPESHPISLLGLATAQPISTEIYLSELGQQVALADPVNVYLAAPPLSHLACELSGTESSVRHTRAVQELVNVVATLRSPQRGCPWDLAQTPQSLIPYVIEEAYEVVDAIRSGDRRAIAEELGDLLLQVILQAQIAGEQGAFTLTEIAQGITQKLVRRHPHVFGDAIVQTVDQVQHNWNQIEAAEKAEAVQGSLAREASPEPSLQSQGLAQSLSRYARSLPPLMAGMKISKKAAAAGFEWSDIAGVWAKFYEELGEFQAALLQENAAEQQAELGDLLFTVINLARWYQLDPSEALRGTSQRFIRRLSQMEANADQPLSAYALDELEARWQDAKLQLKQL